MMGYREAMAQPMLSPEEEADFVERWYVYHDPAARTVLINSHVRICYRIAAQYAKNEAHIKDLAQEGVFGLMRAIEKFDPTREVRFATYATWWVKTNVSQSVSRVSTVVDIPPRVYLKARSAKADEDESVDWVARQAARGDIALDAPVGEDGEMTMLDMLPSHQADPEAEAIRNNRDTVFKRVIADAMTSAMTPREAEVLRRRRLNASEDTMANIARDLKVSRERVRQIEMKAMDKLRRYFAGRGLASSDDV